MRRSAARAARTGFGLAAVVVVLSAAPASTAGRSWRLEHGEVQVTVPLKPGGAFSASTTAIAGTLSLDSVKPARLGGEISVDMKTVDTGIPLRNQHLRETYLETARGEGYEKAVLSAIVLADAESETFNGSTSFTGTLLLHGVKHDVAGKVEIRTENTTRRVKAEFPLTLTDHGVVPPEYLGVGVGARLLVKVTADMVPAP
jgi:polyisoprenoid-binding protein YceI